MPNSRSTVLGHTLMLMFLPIASVVHEPTLRQLNVVFRHGDRTPEVFPQRFPNDPHMSDSFHPIGPGSLTNMGKRRMYRLGERLRERYAEFLGADYEERRLHGVSSSLPRTKMSLQLVLAALYPPSLSSSSKWHESLDWQPIPTHYHEFEQDKLFAWDKCDMYVDEVTKVYNSNVIQKKLKQYEHFLEDLRLIVGKRSPLTLDDILILHNNLNIEKEMNLLMKPWMIDILNDERLKKMRMLYYEISGYNDLLNRLKTGLLLRRIIEDMLQASNKTLKSPQKISLYSGHDKNIIGILQALKIYDSHFPEYTSALIFELLSKKEEFYVKVVYYLGIPEEIKNFTIPGCAILCPLKQFINLTKSAQISDEEMNSKISVKSYFKDNK